MPIELARRLLGGNRRGGRQHRVVRDGRGGRRRGRFDRCLFHDARVIAGVRHHADFGVRELLIGLDAIDQRGAARRRGKEALEHDETGLVRENRLERLNRLRIGKREQIAFFRKTIAQTGH